MSTTGNEKFLGMFDTERAKTLLKHVAIIGISLLGLAAIL
jgi:hypothetical protein